MKAGDWAKYYEMVQVGSASFDLTMKMCRIIKVCKVMCWMRVLVTDWHTNAVHLSHPKLIRKTELTVIK